MKLSVATNFDNGTFFFGVYRCLHLLHCLRLSGNRHERLLPPDMDGKRRCCDVAISLEKRYFFLNGRSRLLITLFTIIYRIFAVELSMIHYRGLIK